MTYADTARQHTGQAEFAHLLADRYADQLMHVHGLGWFHWTGTHWAEDDRGHSTRAVLELLRTEHAAAFGDKARTAQIARLNSAGAIAGVLDIARALPPFAFTVDQLDADPWALNTPTGTLDLHTLTLADHNPADRITKITRGAYRPPSPWGERDRWTEFLKQVLPDPEVRAFLQRVFGMSLIGLVREHVLPILTGPGGNGKGVTYGAVTHALGDYAVIPDAGLFMASDHEQHPTRLLDLRGRRLAVVSESDDGRRLAEATVKRLTGGDPITARRMRHDNVTFQPAHTAVLVTNHLPRVRGDDPALWRRLLVVPFDVVIPDDQQQADLGELLQVDADAVLSWAAAGLADYQASGLAPPEPVRIRTERYRLESDALSRFLDDCCYRSPAAYVPVGDLFERWCKWAAEDGAEPMSAKRLGQELDRRGITVDRTHAGRVRRGIALLADEEEPDQ